MGKAGAVVQFKHRIKRHTVRSAVHHGQVTGGDALILQQLFKNHTRNTARKVNKVIVVLHLLQKGESGRKRQFLLSSLANAFSMQTEKYS